MVKKLFVLASVTALTGMMTLTAGSGCSSTTTQGGDPGTGTEGGPKTPPKEAGPIIEEDGSTGPQTCPTPDPVTAADIDMAIKWAPPAAVQSVCTQQNIDDLKALFVKGMGKAKYADIKTSLGTTCSACVFSKDTAANWQVLVENATMGTFNNGVYSCVAQSDGAKCGKAFFQAETCFKVVCPEDTCTDQDGCATKAGKGACKALVAAANQECPDLAGSIDKCGGILDAIVASCAGGPDAGIDASSQ